MTPRDVAYEDEELCPECEGTGRAADESPYPSWADETPSGCPTCNGRGYIR